MKIGFIGLGIMGKPMSKNLLKAGHEVIVCDVVRAAVDELVAAGAKAAASPRDIAPQVELVITMLPNSPEVKQVVLGKDGILEGAKAGLIVADMSSIAPLASREVAAKLAEKGVEMLDAPVSGGQPKAIDGTLSVMVGGKQEVFDRCSAGVQGDGGIGRARGRHRRGQRRQAGQSGRRCAEHCCRLRGVGPRGEGRRGAGTGVIRPFAAGWRAAR